MKTIYVFRDKSTSDHSTRYLHASLATALMPHGYDVQFMNAHDVLHNAWDRPGNIFVLGGGSFGNFKEQVGEEGIMRIRRFVYAGGGYIGICMGSYAASRMINFRGNQVTKISNGFNFVNHMAIGSLPITPVYFEGTSHSATIIPVHHVPRDIIYPSLYWGGNYFDIGNNDDPHITITNELTMQNGSKYVIGLKARVGDEGGWALMTGTHVEAITCSNIARWILQFSSRYQHADMQRINIELSQHPRGAYAMGLACLLDDAAIVPHHSFVRQIWKDVPLGMQDQSVPEPLSLQPKPFIFNQ